VNPLAPSFDTVGILAQSADVLAKVALVLLAGAPVSANRPTIHLIREAFALADPDVQKALSVPLQRLREIFGGAIRESSLQELLADDAGHSFATWVDSFCVIQWAEIESCLGAWIANTKPEFGPRDSCEFSTDEPTRSATPPRGGATTRTIFSKFARVSRTGRSAVHPNNTRNRSSQGRSTQTQFEWERLLSSRIIADEHCRDGAPAASVTPNSRRRWCPGGAVVTCEAWTGLILVGSGEEC
jgi:hypothetical protein